MMNYETMGLFFFLAIIAELLDSSLGMLYGTLLSPLLIISGFEPNLVVPSILLSQAIGGLIASVNHHRLKNVDFTIKEDVLKRLADLGYIDTFKESTSRDLKVVFSVTSLGIIATIIGAIIAISIPKVAVETYIGVVVLLMGIILLLRSKFEFSWKKVFGIALLSAFNKGISGGGFGPVVTAGQVISGIESKRSIGATTLSEAPICIAGFLTYLIKKGMSDWTLVSVLCLGSIIGAIVGPYLTAKFTNEKVIKKVLGSLVTLLGIWTLVKIWLLS